MNTTLKRNSMKRVIWRFFALLLVVLFYVNQTQAQDVYANVLTDSTSDFQDGHNVVDGDRTNYASLSNLLSVLSSSYLRVQFPQAGKAGDVVNVTVSGTAQTLGVGLLNNVTIRLYDSSGNNVATETGSSLLNISLLAGPDSLYLIKFVTNPTDTFTFKEARIEYNNTVGVNLLNEIRVYNVYYQEPCPPTYADNVYAFGTNGLLTGFVTNSGNAVDANMTNYATLVNPLNLLSLLPPAYLDLEFPNSAPSGHYVGFTVSQASSLLNLALLDDIQIRVYDENGTLRETKSNLNTLDLELLSTTGNIYSLGFVSATGNYRISRIRIQLEPVLGLLQNLNVYNAFHYALERPPVVVTASGSTTVCQGDSITLTAEQIPSATGYMWSTGATTRTITVSQSGTYYVTATDSFTCTRRSADINVNVVPLPSPTIIGDSILCAGVKGGVLGTSMPYTTYLWSNASTSSTISVDTAGVYSIAVVDSNGCAGSDNVTVVRNDVDVSASIVNSNCSNNNTGSVSLNVTGGSGMYKYMWSDGTTMSSDSNLAPGVYTAIVSDSVFGCSYNNSYSIIANNTLTVKSSVVNTSACGMSDGSVAITVVGGSGSYSYAWSNSATTQNLSNVSAGIYTVNITDQSSGCVTTHTVVVSDSNSSLMLNGTIAGAKSCTSPNGSVSLAVTGGSGNYTYLWSTGGTSSFISGLSAGTYHVVVTDTQNNCSKAMSYKVEDSAALMIAGTVSASTCSKNTGSVTLNVTGGSSSYNYMWSDGSTNANLSNAQAGTYIVKVTDNTTGCTGSEVFTVAEGSGPVATLDVTQPSCGSNANGAIAVNTSGVNTYMWSTGATTKDITGLKPGMYTVKITDSATGCSANYSAELIARQQIGLVANVSSNTSCASSPDGAVDVNVTGGTAPFIYTWSNSATTEDIANVFAGNYALSITDSNGCANSIMAVVTTDSSKLIDIAVDTVMSASCNTIANASVSINVTGGKGAYSYAWSNGDTTKNLSNILSGDYTVTVTDSVGCSKSLLISVPVDSTNLLTIGLDSAITTGCLASTRGAINITPSGGTTPYSYMWSNNATTQDLTGITAGSYTLTLTDDNGCTAQRTVSLAVDTTKSVKLAVDSVVKVDCASTNSGSVLVTTTGGVMPYTYSWSNSATSEDITNVAVGNYTLVATDDAGCTATISAAVTKVPIFVMTPDVNNVSCYGAADGSIGLTLADGSGSYSYSWSNNETTNNISNLAPGTYIVTVTDNNTQCMLSDTLTVTEPDSLSVITTSVKDDCNNTPAGEASAIVTGGITPYSYNWSNNGTAATVTGLTEGTYTVIVTDANSCQSTRSQLVEREVCDFAISIPDVITPNNDGTNDNWVVQSLQYYTNNTVQIFNKWGDMVYEKKNYDNTWSGTKTNGEPLADGTYYYLILLNESNRSGGDNVFKGYLMIQR